MGAVRIGYIFQLLYDSEIVKPAQREVNILDDKRAA